jgi:hypothetical protein
MSSRYAGYAIKPHSIPFRSFGVGCDRWPWFCQATLVPVLPKKIEVVLDSEGFIGTELSIRRFHTKVIKSPFSGQP